MKYVYLCFMGTLLALIACTAVPKNPTNGASPVQIPLPPENPAATGFDAAGSDPAAVVLADAVMLAQGSRAAWDNTHYISWNFFGARTLLWDKWTGLVRIEWLKRPLKVIVDIDDNTGKVWMDGAIQTHPDTLKKYLDMGKKVWINDSYWLAMPYKLKDSGVTLKSLGQSATADGRAADLLQLTFKGVGVTPDNKYQVWVDRETHLVSQWAFFNQFTDEKPRFTNPWKDYKRYGSILLSGDRGRGEAHLNPIQVLSEVPEGTFERF